MFSGSSSDRNARPPQCKHVYCESTSNSNPAQERPRSGERAYKGASTSLRVRLLINATGE